MNKKEAKNLLKESLDRYRKYSYGEIQSSVGKIEVFHVKGEYCTQYQVEIQIFWDDKHQQNVRVMGAIDDGGWRAFLPLTESYIMAPDGSFVGE